MIAGVLIAAPMAQVVRAETYLTEDRAVQALFPGKPFRPQWAELSPGDIKKIQDTSGERVLSPRVRVWWGPGRQAVLIDRVIGKHEYITYAVGVGSDGRISGVEILDYRETRGYEIRRPQWRKQFVGKTAADPLRVNKDIQNISGATLSSTHVTNGIRRVLETYQVLKDRG